ncbi:MAG: TonB-dependent receptor [Saprospiraceae bacterium]
MRNIALVLFVVLLGSSLDAQIVRRLKVLDQGTNEPLSFATVLNETSGSGGFTDSIGLFHFTGKSALDAQRYKVSYLGYQTRQVKVEAGVSEAVVYLTPLENTLKEFVVSGTLKEVQLAASPVPVAIYTAQFFKSNPTPGLFDGLVQVNGVQPQINCNVCNTGDIHINGLEGPYTMVLIDGMPIVSSLSTVYGLQGIPNSLVERVEIVKGPASTLYGSEAVAGLINIITKDPRRAPGFVLDINRSGYGETSLDIAGKLRTKNSYGLLSANGFDFSKKWDVNGDNFTDVTLQRRGSVFGKWAFDLAQNKQINLAMRYVSENRYGGEMQWDPRFYGTDSIYGEAVKTDRVELIGNWNLPMKEDLDLSWSWNRHIQRSAYGTTLYNGDQQVGFTQLVWNKPFAERHDLVLGGALRYTWFDDNTAVTDCGPSEVWLPGIFAQDEIQLSKSHTLLAGLRYDWNAVHGNVWSPRLNWKWTPADRHTLRFSLGNGYRVANIFSEDHAALTGSREVVLAEKLAPERSWNANANYHFLFFPSFGIWNVDFSIFYTHFTNRIIADYDADPNKVLYANLDGKAISKGVAVNTDLQFTNSLKIRLGVTLMDVYAEEEGQRARQVHAPPFSGNWTVSYTWQKANVVFDYTGSFNSPMRLPVLPNDFRPEYSPWYSLQNILGTWNSGGQTEVYAGVKNLLNFLPQNPLMRPFDPFDKQANDPIQNPFGYTFDTTYNYAPMQGIRWIVGLRIKLDK